MIDPSEFVSSDEYVDQLDGIDLVEFDMDITSAFTADELNELEDIPY